MNKGTAIDIPSIMFAEGVKAERDRIVTWLRGNAQVPYGACKSTVSWIADAIERGEHLK